jgi:hypothetical protein
LPAPVRTPLHVERREPQSDAFGNLIPQKLPYPVMTPLHPRE